MRQIALTFLMILFLFSCQKEKEAVDLSLEDEIVSLVNQHRNTKGLSTLETSTEAANEALIHSQNMAEGSVAFGHDGFDDRVASLKSKINQSRTGENVAAGQTTAEEVMEDWLNSDGHRANIEGDFTHIGVGVAQTKEGEYYFTQIFVKL